MGDDLQTQDSYATYIFNEWREILRLSERVRTNFFVFLDREEVGDEDYSPANEEKEELYQYISKLVGLYSAAYPKIMGRGDFKDFQTEFEVFEEYYTQPWLLLKTEGNMDKFKTLSKMEQTVGKALEKLSLLTFET